MEMKGNWENAPRIRMNPHNPRLIWFPALPTAYQQTLDSEGTGVADHRQEAPFPTPEWLQVLCKKACEGGCFWSPSSTKVGRAQEAEDWELEKLQKTAHQSSLSGPVQRQENIES